MYTFGKMGRGKNPQRKRNRATEAREKLVHQENRGFPHPEGPPSGIGKEN